MRSVLKVIAVLLLVSNLCYSQSDNDVVLKQKIAACKEDTTKVNLIIQLSAYEFKNHSLSDSALVQILQPAMALAQKLKFHKGFIRANIRAALYTRMHGNYSKSIRYLDDAHKICIQTKDSSSLFSVYNSKGSTYWSQGNFSAAAEYYFKALDIAEALKDNFKLSQAYNGIGNLYIEQNNCKKAVMYHLKGLKIRLQLKDSLLISHSYVNLGAAYYKCNHFDSSIFYYSKALQIQTIRKNKVGQAYSYDGIASNYYYKDQFSTALSYFKRASALLAKSDDVDEILENLIGTGQTSLKLNSKDSALKYLNKAKEISEKINKLNARKIVYAELTNYYELINDHEKALQFNKLANSMKDSIFGNESTKKIASIEYKYQVAQDKKIQELQEAQVNIIHETELKKQKVIIYSFIIGFLFIIVFSVFVYKSYKQKSESNRIITAQKEEVELKNELIEEKQKEILDSIHYAKRIQTTLLAHKDFLDEHIKENFVLFKPKDIVSGDFYWATSVNSRPSVDAILPTHGSSLFYLAVCDSTGHGVPGAFMSLISISFLNEAINEKGILKPNEVLDYVREKLIRNISKDGQKDGFDGILLCLNKNTSEITYAAANNAPLIVSGSSFTELPSDRMPVGHGIKEEKFSLHTINLKKGEALYLYTDGYADQFGGPKGKKFMYKRLNELLVSVSQYPSDKQHSMLTTALDEWRGNLEQVDDVCLIGLRL